MVMSEYQKGYEKGFRDACKRMSSVCEGIKRSSMDDTTPGSATANAYTVILMQNMQDVLFNPHLLQADSVEPHSVPPK